MAQSLISVAILPYLVSSNREGHFSVWNIGVPWCFPNLVPKRNKQLFILSEKVWKRFWRKHSFFHSFISSFIRHSFVIIRLFVHLFNCSVVPTVHSFILVFAAAEICYPPYGCFNNDAPYDEALVQLPWSPKELDTKFYFFNRTFRGQPVGELDPEDTRSASKLQFNPKKKTVFITHGYVGMFFCCFFHSSGKGEYIGVIDVIIAQSFTYTR